MTGRNENAPTTPESLAANGVRGEGANADGVGMAEHIRPEAKALFLALTLLDAAAEAMAQAAMASDEPPAGTVEAADMLDAARALLARAVAP